MSQATRKQIAYLTYMGVNNAESLTKEEAAYAIEHLLDTDDANQHDRLSAKQSNWRTDRFILHPDLYAAEVAEYLAKELPESLHAYTRTRVTGASERLTKEKIRAVVKDLSRDNAEWWRSPDQKVIFFERLKLLFPACVDGRPPLPKFPAKPKGKPQAESGCLVILLGVPAGVALVYFGARFLL